MRPNLGAFFYGEMEMILKVGLGLGAIMRVINAPSETYNLVSGAVQVVHLGTDVVITI